VKNHNWELLSDRLWHHVARQVGFYCGDWNAADTSAYLLLRILFSDAQHYAMTYGIAIGEGLGKTLLLRAMRARMNQRIIYHVMKCITVNHSWLRCFIRRGWKQGAPCRK
jgi:hypothetical protein